LFCQNTNYFTKESIWSQTEDSTCSDVPPSPRQGQNSSMSYGTLLNSPIDRKIHETYKYSMVVLYIWSQRRINSQGYSTCSTEISWVFASVK